MKKDWVLTQEAFDVLLQWLDEDRDNAAREYERIQRKLIRMFLGRGCPAADELTDETINRVTVKVPSLTHYEGDKVLYFYRVADYVYREWNKIQPKPISDENRKLPPDRGEPLPDPYYKEKLDQCLKRCLDELSEESRDLFLEFNNKEKRAKIEHRKTLAIQCGITLNALRIRAHRIRIQLKQCITKCLEEMPAH